MARKRARDDREVERSVRKSARQIEAMERALARIERKLVKAQVILTETAVRASDLEERMRVLRAKLGLAGPAERDADGDTGAEAAGSHAAGAAPLEVAVGSDSEPAD